MTTYHNWNGEVHQRIATALLVQWKWWVSFRYKVWKLTWLREFCCRFVSSFLPFFLSFYANSVLLIFLKVMCNKLHSIGHFVPVAFKTLWAASQRNITKIKLQREARGGLVCKSAWGVDCCCDAACWLWLLYYYRSTAPLTENSSSPPCVKNIGSHIITWCSATAANQETPLDKTSKQGPCTSRKDR